MEDVKDVSNIQDEDILRRMWHETTDSTAKKAIRTHMFRLREARLKEFYTTGEVLRDVQRSNSSPGLRPEPFKDQGPNHAESLADQSFLSLKSKEIRDSESPTREVQYKNSKNRDQDGGWTISTSVDISPDGKTTTRSQKATTSGSRPLEGGQLSYAAANQHQVSVHSDGDDQNYTRSLGEASSTFAHQEAVQGDENNFTKSQTTTKTSSKKTVSSSRQEVGDGNIKMITGIIDDGQNLQNIEKRNENVSRSTTSSTNKSSKVVQQSSTAESTTKISGQDQLDNIQTTRTIYCENPQIQSSKIQDGGSTTTITKTTYTSDELPADLKKSIADGKTKVFTETKTLPDGSTITTTRYETIGTKKISSGATKTSSSRQTVDQKSSTNQQHLQSNTSGNNIIVTTKTHEIVEPVHITKQESSSRQTVDQRSSTNQQHLQSNTSGNNTIVTTKTHEIIEPIRVTKQEQLNNEITSVTNENLQDCVNQKVIKVIRTIEDQEYQVPEKTKEVTTVTVTKEVENDNQTKPTRSRIEKRPQDLPRDIEKVKSYKPEESYKPSSPTDGQYSTTYGSEFTNKRISVDVSATHDAFARSLRSISPDRISERPKSRSSTTSLRSSTSPEKNRPERKSPEKNRPDSINLRRSKSPDRFVQTYSPGRTPTSPSKTERKIPQSPKSPAKDISPIRRIPQSENPTKQHNRESPTKGIIPVQRSPSEIPRPISPAKSAASPFYREGSPVKSPVKDISPVYRSPASPQRNVSPVKDSRSPVLSPTKDITINTDITRKINTVDTTVKNTDINTDTITRKKKTTEQTSPVRSTKTVETTETIINTDTLTKKKKPETSITVTETNTDTITRKKKPTPAENSETSGNVSPTSLASDIEFINHNSHIVTDLDDLQTPEITETIQTETFEQVCEVTPEKPTERPPLKRTETYEERCRQMLGLPEPDKIPKKDYNDMYAGMEPVEEPMIVKKFVAPLNPDDDLMEKTMEKIRKRKPENVKPEDFIHAEKRDTVQTTPERRVPDRKSPEKMPPTEGQYNTEYTDEFYNKPSDASRRSPERKPQTTKDGKYDTEYTDEFYKKPTKKPSKPSSPERKSPTRKPSEGQYSTEYVDEYCKEPQKPTTRKPLRESPEKTQKKIIQPVPTITGKPSSPVRKPLSPERKPLNPERKQLSPERKPLSPERKQLSPERKQLSPERKQLSPERKPLSPERKQMSPERKPSSPVRKPSTERKSTSPEKQKPQRTISVAETVILTDRKTSPERKPSRQTPEKPQKTIVKTTDTITVTTDKKPSSINRKPLRDTQKPLKKDNMEFSTEYTDEFCEITGKYIKRKPAGVTTEPKRHDISPVQSIPEITKPKNLEREPERISPSRESPGLPDNKSVTEYINEYCENTTNDFINKEKYDTDMTLDVSPDSHSDLPGYMRPIHKTSPEERDHIILETRKRESVSPDRRTTLQDTDFNLETENIQENLIRTHRIDTKVTERDISPKRQIQRAVPSETMECSIKIEEKKKTDIKKPQKKEIVDERRSPVKQINKKDTPNKITNKTITKRTSAEINVNKLQEKKRPVKERSPDRVETKKKEDITRKISQKDITIKKQTSKPSITPVKSLSKPISAVNKPSTPVKTPSKPSPKPTKPSSTITTTVKTTKTTKKTIQHDSDTSDSEIETRKRVVTTTNIKLSTKPSVTMPTIKVNKEKTNCITTKTIVLNNDIEQEFIIDLQRSTSSREPSPDKICPIPVSSEDESCYPRYPDQVSEPDDIPKRRRPERISDIPLTEEEDVKTFSRFTEIIDTSKNRITDIDMVQETDESLLSVTEKVSKFITTAEKLTEDEPKLKTPAPKVPRPELVVDENLENDECLLSVSDKVSKFITTAEQTKITDKKSKSPQPTKPIEFKVNENDECLLSVNQKVNHFIQAAEDSKQISPKDNRPGKPSRPEIPVDDSLKKDECLLSVSDKVNKFLTTAEKLTTSTKTEAVSKRTSPERTIPQRSPSPEKRRESPEKITRTEIIYRREPSPEKRQSPIRKTEAERPKSEPSKPVNLKSSEAVKKAKEMFENISKTTETSTSRQKDILTRPSIWEGRKKEEVKLTDIGVYHKKDEVKKQLIYDENTCKKLSSNKDVTLKSTKLILDSPNRSRSPNPSEKSSLHPERSQRSRSKSPNSDLPGYMRPIHKTSPEERDQIILETRHREIHSQERDIHKYENGDVPHYMLPLHRQPSPDRSVHEKESVSSEYISERCPSPEKDIPGYMRPLQRQIQSPEKDIKTPKDDVDDGSRAEKKFGVTLRRTDSGRVITTTTTSSTTERRRSSTPGQPNIEEIQDLDVLERMMDKVIGYEQRRRIRAQIRIVKKLISENKIQKRSKIASSPIRETPVQKSPVHHEDRRSPIRDTKRSNISPSKSIQRQKSPEIRSKIDKVDTKIESKSSYSITTKSERSVRSERSERTLTSSKERSISPEPKKVTQKSSQTFKPDLKHIQPSSKTMQDDKPSWITNRNLKKAEEKRTTTMVKKTEARRSPSPQKDIKPIDCITSSYGIGPTDENGQPLFGIRALRKAADSKVQIRGTVVTSQYYSENGEEPIGEITVTKYSNNPKELNIDDEQINKSKGLTSVTTTQKFGQKGTPTFSSITDKKKSITDKEDELFKTTTKVNRRGSVKALSQKFIENQGYQSSREKISLESITSERKNVQESSTTAKTFLNSHTKVSNAQEVITRMKNAETEHHEGDSAEDREARMLLNKFLGAQVLMSGMEPLLGSKSTLTSSSQLVRKVQKTTVKESSKPVSITKRFQTPITAEVLQDIWDEKTLRALLEQCTDYEERRAIRARLRQVMAEQEVAQVISSAMDDRSHERIETTKKTVTEGPVTTTQVSTPRVVQQSQVNKPISPFAKFRQLDKQHSLNSPPSSPRTTGTTGTGPLPLFKFTDPAVSLSAATVKERLLVWCQIKTKEYQNIKLENFSTSWADGMAFCALIHHFLPDAFDYHALNPKQRRHNFTLAFKVADEQAGIFPLLDVDDMVAMRRPDWKCVFTYVQSIYRRFKDDD